MRAGGGTQRLLTSLNSLYAGDIDMIPALLSYSQFELLS